MMEGKKIGRGARVTWRSLWYIKLEESSVPRNGGFREEIGAGNVDLGETSISVVVKTARVDNLPKAENQWRKEKPRT